MISQHYENEDASYVIVLRPNQSWTWRANTWLIASLLLISLVVGGFFLLHSYWVILPFTLVEVALVAACLYYCVRRTHQQEVLTLTSEQVVLERGIRKPDDRRSFERYFTRFFVHPPRFRGHRRVVALRHRGEETEVGSFLTDEERQELVATLRSVIAELDHQGPTQER